MRPALARVLPLTPAATIALVAALALGGCGSLFGQRYNNFRAYYNTYYNASRSLEDGERALSQAAVTIDRGRLVPVFPTATASGTTGPFQDAIDKSAELLRQRPDSKWADDALLVIGKAYFYQRNLAGAEQKFRETMAAAEAADDRRLGDEARFWLGRTYAAGDRFDEGVAVLEEGLADTDGRRRWTSRMRLALGELYARAGRWDEAAETLRAGAPGEDDGDVAARAYVLLGQVEEHAGRWDAAADAYADALDRRPAYELGFAAQVGRALVLGVDAGRSDEALREVRRMRADDKNYARRAELALVEARLRAAAGERGPALGLFRSVLYSEDLRTVSGPIQGEVHYRLGQFYRDGLGDYVRASAHFDSAATSLRAPAADARASREAILDVAGEARTYSVLAGAARRIAETDSLLALGALSDDDFRVRIDAMELRRRQVYLDEQRQLEAARTAALFSGTGSGDFVNTAQAAQQGRAPVRTVAPGRGVSGQAGGFLSYRDPASVQAGRIAFEQRWGVRPLAPDWRRRSAVLAGDLASDRGVVSSRGTDGFGLGEGPPPLDLTAIPRTAAKRAEMTTELAGLRYELANAFFLSLGRADTAASIYRSILDETPTAPVAVRARYALAEIERDRGRDDAARPLYEAVAQADTLALGRASRARLGIEEAPVPDADLETSAAYDAARAQWQAGDPLGAARALIALADAAPDRPTAPRAYLAAAAAYAQAVGADSVALAAPLPDSLVSLVLLAALPDAAGADASDSRPPATLDAPPPAAPPADDPALSDPDATPDPAAARSNPRQMSARELQQRETQTPTQEGAPPAPVGAPVPVGVPAQTGAPAQIGSAPGQGAPELAAPAQAAGRPAQAALARTAPRPGPVVRPDSGAFTLRHHVAAISERYAGTPYADRARALLAALPEPPPPVVVAPATPLAVAVDTTQAPPALDEPIEPSSTADVGLPETAPASVAGESAAAGLRGDEPIDPSLGGYTWQVRRVSIAAEGLSMTEVLRRAGYRVATLRDDSSSETIVALGQFETEAAADAARDGLPAWAQIRGVVVEVAAFAVVAEDAVPADGR